MKNKLIAIYFIVFITHQIAEKLGFNNSFIDSYLDDFLFLPLFLFTLELIISVLSQLKFELSIYQKVFTIILILTVVEALFPIISNRFIFDWFDFLAYGLGYIFYIGILNYSKNDKLKIT